MHGPTHNRGHTLDLLITRGLNISSIVIKDVALSDHFCIFFDILISVTTESRSVSVRKRCINENTSVLFMKAISLTPSISADSVDLLLDSFDSKVKNVIDDIAPIKVSKKNGRQKSFWRKSTAVQNMKRQCRKAERMWRNTKLEIHYSIYKDSLHAFNLELATARQTFFSNLINSNLNNTRTLFATVERLTNPPSQIPSEMLSDSKCNEFASFLSEKISNIRKEIGTSSCNTGVTQIRQQSKKEMTMSVFKTIDSKILEEIVQHLKSSTCYLDTLPTSFFKSVLNCLEADLLEVVNTSLLSGTFPNSLKTAVVKPLLKKRNLDNTMLSNYRPISNLPFIGKIIEKVVFNQLNNYLLPKKSIRQLQLIQNAAARILTRTRKSEHITPVLRSLHWIPVTFRIDFKVLLLVYKSLNGIGPKYMADMLTEYKPNRPLRSLGSSQLEIPRVHTKQGESAFSYYAARSWNQLPEEIRCAKTLATFKSRLKTHLFSCAFVE